MNALRTFLRNHRRLSALIVALALAMKVLVPVGYMIGQQGKVLTVGICADASGAKMTRQIVLPQTGHAHEHAKADTTCPYAALGMATLSGVDPVLRVLGLGYILALAFAPVRPVLPTEPLFLRPPLRGPPAHT
jgi:hypothetical protein